MTLNPYGKHREFGGSMRSKLEIRRRQFLGQMGGLVLGTMILPHAPRLAAQTAANAAQLVTGKDP